VAALPVQAKMKKLGQSGMSFLSIGGSARAAAMGNILSFAKNDLGNVFYNPAGLASVENRAFYFNYTSWIADMNVSHMAVSWNANKYGVFALHAQMMDYGEFNGTAIANNDLGYEDVEVGDVGAMAIGLGYGIRMTDRFSIGGNLKYINQQLGQNDTYVGDVKELPEKENKVSTVAFDFGTTYDTGIRSILLTMSIRNYAGQQLLENEEFQIPQTYRIGIAANLFELLPYSPGEGHKAVLALEGIDAHDRPEYLNLGLEYSLKNMLDLRVGWATDRAQDVDGGICAGAGFKLDTEVFDGKIDISYSDYGSILGSVMQFAVSGSF
jgi:hypothetical protein